jgi:hypothetical protein
MPSLAVERARKSEWLILILRCGFKFPLGLPNARPLCSLRIFLCVLYGKKRYNRKENTKFFAKPAKKLKPVYNSLADVFVLFAYFSLRSLR